MGKSKAGGRGGKGLTGNREAWGGEPSYGGLSGSGKCDVRVVEVCWYAIAQQGRVING